jgi:hypothetical protein
LKNSFFLTILFFSTVFYIGYDRIQCYILQKTITSSQKILSLKNEEYRALQKKYLSIINLDSLEEFAKKNELIPINENTCIKL